MGGQEGDPKAETEERRATSPQRLAGAGSGRSPKFSGGGNVLMGTLVLARGFQFLTSSLRSDEKFRSLVPFCTIVPLFC